jgi:hypothetical protein
VNDDRAQHQARANGRIGGLTAWARNDATIMLGPAHRAWKTRFEREVDPEGALPEPERLRRADRARRAHMLSLARRSAEVRRARAREVKNAGDGALSTVMVTGDNDAEKIDDRSAPPRRCSS